MPAVTRFGLFRQTAPPSLGRDLRRVNDDGILMADLPIREELTIHRQLAHP